MPPIIKVRVVDFETTGTDKEKRAGKPVEICEIGYTDLRVDTRDILQPVAHLVNPGLPVPPEARAIHHISDAEVAGAMHPATARAILMDGMNQGDLFCAHNASFEQAFFPGGTQDWICTYKVARHLYDELPSYSNQALRYILDIDKDMSWPELAMPPHRAGPDSYVTAGILQHMLVTNTVDKLVALTKQPIILKKVTFGKHEGMLWSDMDAGFCEWILARDFSDEVMDTARHWLRIRRNQSTPYPFA